MKYHLAAITVITLSAGSAIAQSTVDRDLKQLAEQRDRAVAAAVEPVNRRYKADLETLLRKATQAGDLDAAVKIRDLLAKSGNSTGAASTANNPVGTWRFQTKDKSYVRTFHEDGTITGEGFEGAGKWKVTSGKIIISYPNRGDGWVDLPLNPQGTKAQSHNGEQQTMVKVIP